MHTYDANKLISSSGAKAFTFSYDNNGNTITDNNRQYIFNQNQRLIKAVENGNTLGEYIYNGNGQRVKKVANGKSTYYIYDQSGNLIEEADENGEVISDYIYLGSMPIARVDEWWEGIQIPQEPTGVTVMNGNEQLTISWNANQEPVDGYKVYWGTESRNYTHSVDVGKITTYTITGLTNGVSYYIAIKAYVDLKETYYYHTDHLGTPMMMTDKDKNVVWNGEFLPFGEPLAITGTMKNNLRFPGQYYDVETGLHYNWHRDYKPEIGRYVEADPIGLRGGINPFVYAKSNPINNIDPNGTFTISIGTVIIVITVAVAVSYCYDLLKCYQAIGHAQDLVLALIRKYPDITQTRDRLNEFFQSPEYRELLKRCPNVIVQSYTTP